jgi:hypothetical protein
MAFSAERTLLGHEPVGRTTDRELLWLPGNPGITYTKNDRVVYTPTTAGSAGLIILATDSVADAVGRVVKTVVCPAATQPFPVPGAQPGDLDGAAAKCLVLVEMDVPCGVPVRQAPIVSYADETVVTTTPATPEITCTTGFGADDRPNGALCYIYEGPGKGEINFVDDYTHVGLHLQFHRKWNATLTTATKMIVLSATGSANAVGCLGRMDLQDQSAGLEVDDGADDGNFVLYCDFFKLVEFLKNGALPYINAANAWHVTPNA